MADHKSNFDMEEHSLVHDELNAMMEMWGERDANPLVVCTISIIRFITLAGQLFENHEDFLEYVEKTAAAGIEYHEECEREGTKYNVH